MPRMPLAFCCLTLAGFAWPAPAGTGQPRPGAGKKTVAVINFDNNSGNAEYDTVGKGLAVMMITDLSNVEAIQLIERERIQAVMDELELQQSGFADPKTAAKVGRITGAQYLVAGALMALEPDVRIDTRVIRVETAEIVRAAQVTGPRDELLDLQQKLASELLVGLEVALDPDAQQKLAAQKEANHIDDLDTVLAFSQALDLYDQEDFVGAAEKMYAVSQAAPGSKLVKVTYDVFKQRAANSLKGKALDKAKGLLRRRPGGL